MTARALISLTLLCATCALAQSSGFLLGVDYTEWLSPNVRQAWIDNSGALYLLSSTTTSSVTKLSADGKTILWQNQLGFFANTMTVDPNGGVYVAEVKAPPPGVYGVSQSFTVSKINPAATGVAWSLSPGFSLRSGFSPTLAADSQGRVYVAGFNDASGTTSVVRLTATGSGIDYASSVAGLPRAIVADPSGAAFITGNVAGGASFFVARVGPDGAPGFYTPVQQPNAFPTVVLDPSGNAVAYYAGTLWRFDSTGAVTFSKKIAAESFSGFGLDPAGNIYVTGSQLRLYPVKNSVAPCGSDLLSVFAPDGTLLQTTYLPGSEGAGLIVQPDSTVLVMGRAAQSFVPTRTGPFAASGGSSPNGFLMQLSPNTGATILPLACVGNAATYLPATLDWARIAPGAIVSLFGNGLGPQQGTETQATAASPFPTRAANVEVTFDGQPVPLLWVQDAQINAVAPWSLTPGKTTEVCASWNGVKTNCLTLPVAKTSPGVFSPDGDHAAALNQDGTLNTAANPAAPGSIVTIYATGLGPISPPGADGSLTGLPLPVNTMPLSVDAVPRSGGALGPHPPYALDAKDVTYAGPAPFLIAGASQINFKLAADSDWYYLFVPAPQGQDYATQSQQFRVYVAGR